VSVIIIDLNNLKKINDEYGHAAGDLYIKNTATVLKETFRPEDMVARVGGDEFIIILPSVDRNICAQAVDRLRANLEKFNGRSDNPVSLSLGAATTYFVDKLQDCIKEADILMYKEKAALKAAHPDGN
jgi:diguanylate cyclase (GGDEF)-like protein